MMARLRAQQLAKLFYFPQIWRGLIETPINGQHFTLSPIIVSVHLCFPEGYQHEDIINRSLFYPTPNSFSHALPNKRSFTFAIY